jgi:hypothetical protein
MVFDCTPDQAVAADDPEALQAEGPFGHPTGESLRSVYIDTGENGLFAAAEFTAITTLGQMEYVTPEEIAANVVAELRGGGTGRDVVQALDGAVMGPSYRAGILRQAALARLRQLQAEHEDDSVAFEILGPPRLSKLLYEAYLIKRACGKMAVVGQRSPSELAAELSEIVAGDEATRRRILSIGIPILLPDGVRLLRGPMIKAQTAEQGWVDLTPKNVERWQARIEGLRAHLREVAALDSSSRQDRVYPDLGAWVETDDFEVGEIVGWLFIDEEKGRRGKS